MKFSKLSDGFGIETHDADLSQLDDAMFAELWEAWKEHHVLVLRGQQLTAPQFHAWAARVGKPEPHVIDQFHHPAMADILILSNVKHHGQPIGLQDAGTYFHTDYSYLAVPARATTLYSITVPADGGATRFADQQAAYDDLSAEMKRTVDPLIGRHRYGNRDDLNVTSRTVASVLTEEQDKKMDWIKHRIARPNPVNGKTALYSISGTAFGIYDIPDKEAIELLDELKAHSTQPRYLLDVKYGVGDVVLWDNAALLHAATLINLAHQRTLWRITVKEDPARLEVLH